MARPKEERLFAEVSINSRLSRFVFSKKEIDRLTSLGAYVTIIPEPDPLFQDKKKEVRK